MGRVRRPICAARFGWHGALRPSNMRVVGGEGMWMKSCVLAAHLEGRYGIKIDRITEIDSAYRVDRQDGPSWVTRVFPDQRPLEATEGDAEILRFLEEHRFPAERCADEVPVSIFEGQSVLVTGLLPGPNGRPDQSPRTMRAMGDLLGRLHTLPAADGAMGRAAGSWHHLAVAGGARREDVLALEPLMVEAKYAPLRDALADIDLLEDLPDALLHPDFVTANVMLTPDGPMLIDWTGAGRGPRIGPLGLLLSAGAVDLRLVDAIVAGYGPLVRLEREELARLAGAVRAFGLILDCWTAVHYGQFLRRVEQGLADRREQAEAIAARACAAFALI
jgi:Ser/Thr protein kinase RdoA (MazF antagonist)